MVIVSRARINPSIGRAIASALHRSEQRERDIEKRTLRAQSRARRFKRRAPVSHVERTLGFDS
jgi:hypothetical protein